jgi:hypothetical protein
MPPVNSIPGDPDPTLTALTQQEAWELQTTFIPHSSQELLSLDKWYYRSLISLLALQGSIRLGISQSELLCLLQIIRLQHEYNSIYVSTYALSIALNRSLRHVERYIKRFCDLPLLTITFRDLYGAGYDLAPAFTRLSKKQLEVSDAE